jgi:hypothetical protein
LLLLYNGRIVYRHQGEEQTGDINTGQSGNPVPGLLFVAALLLDTHDMMRFSTFAHVPGLYWRKAAFKHAGTAFGSVEVQRECRD